MRDRLIARAAEMGIRVTDRQAAQFALFHGMLVTANRETNLTRVPDDEDEAIARNYLDSIAPVLYGLPAGTGTLVDVGAGAGFPGIPLSIMLPDVEVTLVDSLGKRVNFMKDAVERLGLNAKAVNLRAEEAGRAEGMREAYDVAVSRAVAGLGVLCEFMLPLVRVGGIMIAYKGPTWEAELRAAEGAIAILGGEFDAVRDVSIPGRDWAHRLIYIRKTSQAPDKYPRRPGMPEKRPIST